MKKFMLSFFATVALLSFSSVASAELFGWGGEKIIMVMDFPDEDWAQIPTCEYVDAGYRYKQLTMLFIPLWKYDGRWTGYIGSEKQYLDLDRSELQEFAEAAGLELPDSPSLPFWDSMGGKLLFILIVILYLGVKFRSSPEEEAEEGFEE